MNDRLEFTFGPVQEFVAEARRTRDLWAGSFLLAYLSGAAINSISQNAQIVFPDTSKDPIIKALKEEVCGAGLSVGTLPNRFSAEGKELPALAQKAKAALNDAWKRIADSVFILIEEQAGEMVTKYLKDTWQRQVESHWSVNWVVSNRPFTLEIRKNLRDFEKNEEPGEKCTICGKRSALVYEQGLSRKDVVAFWSKFVERINKNNQSGQQFKPKGRERLCAICTIKRLYPLVSGKALGQGWSSNIHYPSTNFLAVLPFLSELIKKAHGDTQVRNALKVFVETARNSKVPLSEDGMNIPLLRKLDNGTPFIQEAARLDGEVWYESVLNREIASKESSIQNPHNVLQHLKRLFEVAGLGKPRPFYCILVMDGDRMGELLKNYPQKVSAALAEFTEKVTEMQKSEDFAGIVVYSGGDDVLALLAMDQALRCAYEMRKYFVEAFKKYLDEEATISAALVIAHFNMPLQAVVADAHRLLNDVAKDGLNRDSFAVRVWKGSGPILTFAKKWHDHDEDIDWVDEIYHLVDAVNQGIYSSRFLYKLPRLMDFVQQGDIEKAFSEEVRVKLLTAEYMRERNPQKKCSSEEAEERVRRLLRLATWKNVKGNLRNLSDRVTADGPMLVRFLSLKGGDQR